MSVQKIIIHNLSVEVELREGMKPADVEWIKQLALERLRHLTDQDAENGATRMTVRSECAVTAQGSAIPSQGERVETASAFVKCVHIDPSVNEFYRRGLSAPAMVVESVRKLQMAKTRIADLETIAPRKMKTTDGRMYTWRCPDELIPVTELP